MLVAIPHIGFAKGIPAALEQVSYSDVNKGNLIVFNDHMTDASKDRRIMSLFIDGSHHRNLSAIYRAESISSGKRYQQHEPKQSFFGCYSRTLETNSKS